MKDCERHAHIEPNYQGRAEEQERREERRLRGLDNAWEAYLERWLDENPPIEVERKPPAVERMQLGFNFGEETA